MRGRVVNFGQLAAVIIVLSFVWSLAFPSASQGETFFNDDFENHLTPNWDTGACGTGYPDGCNARVATDQFVSGSHSLRGDYNATCGDPGSTALGCGTYYNRVHRSTTEFWWRMMIRHSNMTFSAKIGYEFMSLDCCGTEVVMLTGGPGGSNNPTADTNELWIQIEYLNNYFCPQTGHTERICNYYTNRNYKPFTNNGWNCLEVHVRADSTPGVGDGLLETYVDGIQTMSYPNIHVRDANLGYDNTRHYTQYGNGFRWIDDWAVGTTRIGCGSSPLPSTAPVPPSTLQLSKLLQRLWAWLLPTWSLA